MEAKVYTYQKKYVRADGTVRYYNNSSKYIPTGKETKITRAKVVDKLKEADSKLLSEVYELLNSRINGN